MFGFQRNPVLREAGLGSSTVHLTWYLMLFTTVLVNLTIYMYYTCIFEIVIFFIFRGQMICNLGDCLTSELRDCLPIFLERLKNEITRLTAVKALTMIAG